jgi:hypothetical protein
MGQRFLDSGFVAALLMRAQALEHLESRFAASIAAALHFMLIQRRLRQGPAGRSLMSVPVSVTYGACVQAPKLPDSGVKGAVKWAMKAVNREVG